MTLSRPCTHGAAGCTRECSTLHPSGLAEVQSLNRAFPLSLAEKPFLQEWNQAGKAAQATKQRGMHPQIRAKLNAGNQTHLTYQEPSDHLIRE